MILDCAVVPNVIAAPEDNIVADLSKWLNGVVFEDEAIVADRNSGKNSGFRADVAYKPISLLFNLLVNGFAQPVHATRRHRSKEAKFRRRVRFLNLLESNDRQALENVLCRQVPPVHAEGDDFMLAVVLQVKMRELREILNAENDHFSHSAILLTVNIGRVFIEPVVVSDNKVSRQVLLEKGGQDVKRQVK